MHATLHNQISTVIYTAGRKKTLSSKVPKIVNCKKNAKKLVSS